MSAHDSAVGDDRAPDRYTGHGRETIDRMRDLARFMSGGPLAGDRAFWVHCVATALKYHDRAERKGPKDEDIAKMRWYLQMARHAAGTDVDPRASRPGFVPYEQQPVDMEFLAAVQRCTP